MIPLHSSTTPSPQVASLTRTETQSDIHLFCLTAPQPPTTVAAADTTTRISEFLRTNSSDVCGNQRRVLFRLVCYAFVPALVEYPLLTG